MKLTLGGEHHTITQNQLSAIQEILKPKRWVPEEKYMYYYVIDNGVVSNSFWQDDSSDTFRLSMGNVYRTRKEAEQALKTGWVAKRQAEVKILSFIEDEGIDTEINWSSCEARYCITFDVGDDKFRWSVNAVYKYKYSPFLHFTTKEDAEKVIQHCEKELKVLFGV